jgi:hypothetical protein
MPEITLDTNGNRAGGTLFSHIASSTAMTNRTLYTTKCISRATRREINGHRRQWSHGDPLICPFEHPTARQETALTALIWNVWTQTDMYSFFLTYAWRPDRVWSGGQGQYKGRLCESLGGYSDRACRRRFDAGISRRRGQAKPCRNRKVQKQFSSVGLNSQHTRKTERGC